MMTTQEILETCINRELEPYGVTYDDVKKGGDKDYFITMRLEKKKYFFNLLSKDIIQPYKISWYHHYTFNSEQEYNAWKEFCINLFRKELKMSKKGAEKEFDWFSLSYGLKQNYES